MSAHASPPVSVTERRAAAETAYLQASARAAGTAAGVAGAMGPPPTAEATQALLHELQVHQIELEMQNDELRRAQEQTETWRDHYFDLYELAPVGYCSLSETGLVLQANLTLATLLGVVRGTLLKQPLSRCVAAPDQDDFYRLCVQLLPARELANAVPASTRTAVRARAAPVARADTAHTIEVHMQRGDGSIFWAQLVAKMAPDLNSGDPGVGVGPDRRAAARPVLRLAVSDISARKQVQLELQTALAEQQALLKEVHHRVKNNLQVISSLLRLETGRSAQPDTRSVLADMQGRIHAMAQLHEALYRSGVFATVDLAGYVKGLATQAVRILAGREGSVRLQLGLAALKVTMDQAMPLGLLANELISNAFKHGFANGRSGDLNITLAPLPDSVRWRLCVSDTGAGLPADFAARLGQSLGLQLAGDLARQAGGMLDVGPGPEAVFRIDFMPAAADAAPTSTGHD